MCQPTSNPTTEPATVYWHRELPPLDAELVGEHTVEADSGRMQGTLAHGDEMWEERYRELMATARRRLAQEVVRLGGHFAHVHGEAITPKRDDAAGEAWLHGQFAYMLYRRPQAAAIPLATSPKRKCASKTPCLRCQQRVDSATTT